jgi:hypothetical protein
MSEQSAAKVAVETLPLLGQFNMFDAQNGAIFVAVFGRKKYCHVQNWYGLVSTTACGNTLRLNLSVSTHFIKTKRIKNIRKSSKFFE